MKSLIRGCVYCMCVQNENGEHFLYIQIHISTKYSTTLSSTQCISADESWHREISCDHSITTLQKEEQSTWVRNPSDQHFSVIFHLLSR
jgi:hypothetical protein